jgi:hypothetical protein
MMLCTGIVDAAEARGRSVVAAGRQMRGQMGGTDTGGRVCAVGRRVGADRWHPVRHRVWSIALRLHTLAVLHPPDFAVRSLAGLKDKELATEGTPWCCA